MQRVVAFEQSENVGAVETDTGGRGGVALFSSVTPCENWGLMGRP